MADRDIVARLRDRHGIYLLAGKGHVEMNDPLCDDAADEIEALRTVIYKTQLPENANKFWPEFLSEEDKAVIRRAVTEKI